MVEALLENTCNCFVSSFPAASLQTHGFAFVVLGTNHLVPLAPCLPAWKPQALEIWLNAGGTAIFVSSTPDAA